MKKWIIKTKKTTNAKIFYGRKKCANIKNISNGNLTFEWLPQKKKKEVPLNWLLNNLIKFEKTATEVEKIDTACFWSATVSNNPIDDYNLIIEVMFKDEEVAYIKNENNELLIEWHPSKKMLSVSLEWLLKLMDKANKTLRT